MIETGTENRPLFLFMEGFSEIFRFSKKKTEYKKISG